MQCDRSGRTQPHQQRRTQPWHCTPPTFVLILRAPALSTLGIDAIQHKGNGRDEDEDQNDDDDGRAKTALRLSRQGRVRVIE